MQNNDEQNFNLIRAVSLYFLGAMLIVLGTLGVLITG